MNIQRAIDLINHEHDSQSGLDTLFRLSADIEEKRMINFIEALECIAQHYEDKPMIERILVYKLYSIDQTLQASSGHWKVSRPKGLDRKTCFKVHSTIRSIFSN